MVDMSKNLLKIIMEEKSLRAFPVAGLVEKIQEGYLSEERAYQKPKKSFSPSTLVYGPAGGQCPRRWYFAFEGAEYISDVDAYSSANMKNGILSHERIQEAMKKSGVMVRDEVKVISNDPPIFGFADGILSWLNEEIAAEIKTMREESFQYRTKTGKAPVYHLMQLLIYMRLLKLLRGVLIYESKNSHELFIIPVEMTQEYEEWLDKAFDWMRTVRKAWEDKKLPMKPYRSNSKVCKKCPLRETCAAADKGVVKIPVMETLSE